MESLNKYVNVAKEIQSSDPIGLQYFKAVDIMVNGLEPDKRGYFNILIYENAVDSPSVNILRNQTKCIDGNTYKQDEISLNSNKKRVQFNAECCSDGVYKSYPDNISEEGNAYLTETVKELTRLVGINGSTIVINGVDLMRAKENAWWDIENILGLRKLQLVDSKKQLIV